MKNKKIGVRKFEKKIEECLFKSSEVYENFLQNGWVDEIKFSNLKRARLIVEYDAIKTFYSTSFF